MSMQMNRWLCSGLVLWGCVAAGIPALAQNYETVITRAYEDILGRKPDSDGMRTYRIKMIDERWSEQDVRNDLRKSAEGRYQNVEVAIRRAYQDILGRDPDRSGMENYRRMMLDKGWDERRVRDDLRKSAEGRFQNVDVVIRRAYRDLLGRDPDKGGLENYRRLMLNKGWDENKVRQDIRKSDEFNKRKR